VKQRPSDLVAGVDVVGTYELLQHLDVITIYQHPHRRQPVISNKPLVIHFQNFRLVNLLALVLLRVMIVIFLRAAVDAEKFFTILFRVNTSKRHINTCNENITLVTRTRNIHGMARPFINICLVSIFKKILSYSQTIISALWRTKVCGCAIFFEALVAGIVMSCTQSASRLIIHACKAYIPSIVTLL